MRSRVVCRRDCADSCTADPSAGRPVRGSRQPRRRYQRPRREAGAASRPPTTGEGSVIASPSRPFGGGCGPPRSCPARSACLRAGYPSCAGVRRGPRRDKLAQLDHGLGHHRERQGPYSARLDASRPTTDELVRHRPARPGRAGVEGGDGRFRSTHPTVPISGPDRSEPAHLIAAFPVVERRVGLQVGAAGQQAIALPAPNEAEPAQHARPGRRSADEQRPVGGGHGCSVFAVRAGRLVEADIGYSPAPPITGWRSGRGSVPSTIRTISFGHGHVPVDDHGGHRAASAGSSCRRRRSGRRR